MTYEISKEFHFSASHQLNGLPDTHQCARLHGHNYILKVTLIALALNEVGFVKDYGELGFVKDLIDQWDHRHLNELFPFNPTAENMCRYIWELIDGQLRETEDRGSISTIAVSISETPKTWARFMMGVSW